MACPAMTRPLAFKGTCSPVGPQTILDGTAAMTAATPWLWTAVNKAASLPRESPRTTIEVAK